MKIQFSIEGRADSFENAAKLLEAAANDMRVIQREREMKIDERNPRHKSIGMGLDCDLKMDVVLYPAIPYWASAGNRIATGPGKIWRIREVRKDGVIVSKWPGNDADEQHLETWAQLESAHAFPL